MYMKLTDSLEEMEGRGGWHELTSVILAQGIAEGRGGEGAGLHGEAEAGSCCSWDGGERAGEERHRCCCCC